MTAWLFPISSMACGLRWKKIQQKGKQLIKQDATLQKIKKVGLNAQQEKAIKHLLRNDKLSVNEYQSVASCIRRTAQRDLEELVEKASLK